MSPRIFLVALLVASTAAFVVGVSVERSDGDTHGETAATAESREAAESGEEHAGEAGEGGATEEEEAHAESTPGETDEGEGEETLLGVDLDATPFVALAAAFSIALAFAVWLRPAWGLLLATVAIAMIVFAALDAREVLHQLDEENTGLAVLAGMVAALHLAAAGVALLMGRPLPAPGGEAHA